MTRASFILPLATAIVLSYGCAGTTTEPTNAGVAGAPNQAVAQAAPEPAKSLPGFGLPIDGEIDYLHAFTSSPLFANRPHVAVVYYDSALDQRVLQIMRPMKDGSFDTVFRMEFEGVPMTWDEVTLIDSYWVAGLVVWGGELEGREQAKVICYTRGHFELVYEGLEPLIMDLDDDDIPEILSQHFLVGLESSWQILAWNGFDFAPLMEIQHWEDRYSADVRQALKTSKDGWQP